MLMTDNERKKSPEKRYKFEYKNSDEAVAPPPGVVRADSADCEPEPEPELTPDPDRCPDAGALAVVVETDTEYITDADVDEADVDGAGADGADTITAGVTTAETMDESALNEPERTGPPALTPPLRGSGSDERSGSNRPQSVKLRISPDSKKTVSRSDAVDFHDKTHGHNKLVLLMSKLFLILSVVALSSQFVLMMFIIFRDFILIFYSVDTVTNVICLWLTFHFSDETYNRFCCGRCCTKCCFPIIKAVALSCNEYAVEQQQLQTEKAQSGCMSSKAAIYCKCCCLSSCRYGCCRCGDDTHRTPKQFYVLAKHEIELIVAARDEGTFSERIGSNLSKNTTMVSALRENTKTVEISRAE